MGVCPDYDTVLKRSGIIKAPSLFWAAAIAKLIVPWLEPTLDS